MHSYFPVLRIEIIIILFVLVKEKIFAAFGGDEEKNSPFSRVFYYKKCLKTLIFAKFCAKRQIFSKICLKCEFIDL